MSDQALRLVAPKTTQQAAEAERANRERFLGAQRDVLWALINGREAALPLVRDLPLSMFTSGACRLVFKTLLAMAERGERLGMFELIERMEDEGTLQELPQGGERPGEQFILTLDRKGYVHDVPAVVRRLRRLAASAEALPALDALREDLRHRGGGRFEHLVGDADQVLGRLKAISARSAHVTLSQGTASVVQRWDQETNAHRFVETCFPGLNAGVRGLSSPGMVLLAGDSGAGKSTIAANIADAVASREGALFIGFEMSVEENVARVLSIRTELPEDRILDGALSEEEKLRLLKLDVTQGLEFWGESSKIGAVEAIIAERAASGVRVAFVDHLGRIDLPGRDRIERIENAAVRLAKLAGALGVLIVAMCHLKRTRDQGSKPSVDWIYGGHATAEATQAFVLHAAGEDRELVLVKGRRRNARFAVKLKKVGDSAKVVEV